MGRGIMKLLGLTVQKLYDCYNYNVNFNTDVTFIYGANGCGKTTILNITEAIITGQLFKLFDYTFEKIELRYASSSDLNDIKFIQITNDKESLSIKFDNKEYEFKKADGKTIYGLPKKTPEKFLDTILVDMSS